MCPEKDTGKDKQLNCPGHCLDPYRSHPPPTSTPDSSHCHDIHALYMVTDYVHPRSQAPHAHTVHPPHRPRCQRPRVMMSVTPLTWPSAGHHQGQPIGAPATIPSRAPHPVHTVPMHTLAYPPRVPTCRRVLPFFCFIFLSLPLMLDCPSGWPST